MAYVIAVGNAFDGLVLHGPFESGNAANDYAGERYDDVEWSVVTLHAVASVTTIEVRERRLQRLCRQLIDAVLQHHATSSCDSQPLFAKAWTTLKALDSSLTPK